MRVDGNCENCKFYKELTDLIGECRHNSPIASQASNKEWPIVSNKDWCGMWEWNGVVNKNNKEKKK